MESADKGRFDPKTFLTCQSAHPEDTSFPAELSSQRPLFRLSCAIDHHSAETSFEDESFSNSMKPDNVMVHQYLFEVEVESNGSMDRSMLENGIGSTLQCTFRKSDQTIHLNLVAACFSTAQVCMDIPVAHIQVTERKYKNRPPVRTETIAYYSHCAEMKHIHQAYLLKRASFTASVLFVAFDDDDEHKNHLESGQLKRPCPYKTTFTRAILGLSLKVYLPTQNMISSPSSFYENISHLDLVTANLLILDREPFEMNILKSTILPDRYFMDERDIDAIHPKTLIPTLLSFQKRCVSWMLSKEGVIIRNGVRKPFMYALNDMAMNVNGTSVWKAFGCWSKGLICEDVYHRGAKAILSDEVIHSVTIPIY